MSESPLISVIIPCCNYGRFLGQAVQSVLDQTYPHIEIIVVDDGSTDDTRAVATAYPVTFISQQNLGVCVAMNAGLNVASGEYIMRLDADDVLQSTYVQETFEALQRTPTAAFAYSD